MIWSPPRGRLIRAALIRAALIRAALIRAALIRTVLIRTALIRTVLIRAVLIRAVLIRAVLIGALIIAGYVTAPAVPGVLPTARADEPVSGAFALGGGLGGSVDPRTGQFSVTVPLVGVASRGDSGIELSLSWEQARAGAGLDRAGWGGGWSLGTTFIETEGATTVYPANGGSYLADTDYASGLRYYLQEDIAFAAATGDLPGRDVPGGSAIPDQAYDYTIGYDDGRIDYYDSDGNLIARVDRFGNRTDIAYASPAPDQFQPTTIVDAYGLVTTFDYDSDPGSVLVEAPKRSDGLVPTTTVSFDGNGEVQSVTDPAGNVATFGYTDFQVDGDTTQHLLNTATGPAGAATTVGYQEVDYDAGPTVVIAQTLDVADADGDDISPTRTFDINPTSANDFHNYLGYPDYLPTAGTDTLFERADPNYTYTTQLSTPAAATLSTYDAGHRLISRVVQGTDNDGNFVTATTQTGDFPELQPVGFQPANYSKPTGSTVTFSARSGPNGYTAATGSGRSVSTTTQYDDHGRISKVVDEVGTTTSYAYDPTYGLPTTTTVTGADGSTRTTTNKLTADKLTVKTSTTAVGDTAASATARTVTTYAFDQYGEPTSRIVAWAPGAAPPNDGGGPASATTTYASVIDATSATQQLTITRAAGTPAQSSTTTTIDLVAGLVVGFADELGRITTRAYDAAGRLTAITPPSGLTTKTTYTQATDSAPASKLVTTADGHQTLTSYDALGRMVKVTDNVRNAKFVGDPTTRTVSTHVYAANRVTDAGGAPGTTLTSTDLAGRVTTTVTDGLGKTVLETAANGVTKTTSYDDVANTVTRQTFGDGAARASQIVKTAYDPLNREVSSRTTYPVGSRTSLVDPARLTAWDGIGRQTSVTDRDLVATPDYSGAGGIAATVAVAPAKTARMPGPRITATDTSMIDGQTTLRQLQQPGQDARAGTELGYDAAGRLTSTTDPLGRVTGYTYYDDGQVHTRTSPSGTVTTQTFDPAGRVQGVTSKAADGTTTSVTATYVPAGQPGAGRVMSLTDASGTVSYTYDADGNRTSIGYPDGSSTTSTYGDDGLLSASTDITGAVTTYTYNADTSLKAATQIRNGTTLASVSYTYDGLGRLRTTTRGNGLVTTNTYKPNSLLATQTTVDGAGDQVEAHSYAYDTHHNLVTKTATTAKPSNCTVICVAGPSTFGTWTTSYGYDAYDRLISSSVYSGAKAAGRPLTTHAYVLDVSGNVTSTTRTTRTTGFRPTTTRQVITDQVDAAGQLTQRTTGSAAASQSYDDDGRVITALDGSTTTYRPDGLPAAVTRTGATTTFAYWADGTRRRSTTVDPAEGTTTVELHYSPDGTLLNDTTTTSGTGVQAGSASASYLVTTGREARTLQPGTTPAGAVRARAAAPVTSGAGVGYFLRDRHSSVTALVDGTGSVTNTYSYGDYGAPALLSGKPGTVVGALPGVAPGSSNPLRYTGSALKALYTDTALGTLMTPARFYDPDQGRFTARDTANVHNRYVGFDTNPIMKVDPTGQSPLADFLIDAIYVVVFAIATIATGGAAAAAGAAVFGAEAAVGATVAATATFTAQAVATTANLVGLAANATRFVDDLDSAVSGQHFLSDDQRSDLNNVATVAGSVAGVAGMFSAGAESATTAVEDAAGNEATPIDAGYETDDELPFDDEVAPLDLGESDDEALGSRSRSDSGDLSNFKFSLDDRDLQDLDNLSQVVDRSPGQAATIKDPEAAAEPDDGPPVADRAPSGKTSVLRRAWDSFTGKAAKQAAAAREAEQLRAFNAELIAYIHSDRFAAAGDSLKPGDLLDHDISGAGG